MRSSEKASVDTELLPEGMALTEGQLRIVSRVKKLPGQTGPVVLLPDLSFKPKNPYPTGMVACFKDHLVPTAIGASINCGMSLLRLLPPKAEIAQAQWQDVLQRIDTVFEELSRDVDSVPRQRLYEGLIDPHRFITELGWADEEVARVEAGGFRLCDDLSPEAIDRSIPEFAIRGTALSLGQLGGGNHFVEFHRVREIASPDIASRLGISRDSYTMAVHTSGPLGPLVSLMYSRRPELSGSTAVKMALRKAAFHLTLPAGLRSLPAMIAGAECFPLDSPLGRAFAAAYDAATASGYIHRALIVQEIRNILTATLNMEAELLLDLSHNGIWRETIDGKQLYVHRHGACSFHPAESFAEDHPYGRTGQPAFVGSSMTTPSALFVPGERVQKTYCSINHGTGRRETPPEQSNLSDDEYIRQSGVVVHCRGSGAITEQLGAYYRPIEPVTETLQETGIARLVAILQPVASFKHTG